MPYNRSREDYTMRDGKEAHISHKRHQMEEAQHDASNAFVREQENKDRKYEGRLPRLDGKYMEFNACMVNNGVHAQELARELTRGIDRDAFPVREHPDMSQDD